MDSSSDLWTTVDGVRHFDFDALIVHLRRLGQERYGARFTIHPHDYETYYQLLAYLVNDHKACHRYTLDTSKGILLLGPVGTGKTSIMELMSLLIPRRRRYQLISARTVAYDFSQNGYDCLRPLLRRDLAIDDLGVEPAVRYYGQPSNIIAELLLSRYDLYRSSGIMTHMTSNLDPSALEKRYGGRIRSRLREMCNVIVMDGEDKRR